MPDPDPEFVWAEEQLYILRERYAALEFSAWRADARARRAERKMVEVRPFPFPTSILVRDMRLVIGSVLSWWDKTKDLRASLTCAHFPGMQGLWSAVLDVSPTKQCPAPLAVADRIGRRLPHSKRGGILRSITDILVEYLLVDAGPAAEWKPEKGAAHRLALAHRCVVEQEAIAEKRDI